MADNAAMDRRATMAAAREAVMARARRWRRRLVWLSLGGFAALMALAGRHAVGVTARAGGQPIRPAAHPSQPAVPAPPPFFQGGGGYQVEVPPAPVPPMVQSNVS